MIGLGQVGASNLFGAAPAAIALCNADGSIRYANGAFAKLLGLASNASLLGRPVKALFTNDGVLGDLKNSPIDMSGECGEAMARRADGDSVAVHLSISPIKDAGADGAAWLLVARDTSEERELREALSQANDETETRVAERTAQFAALNQELQAFSYSVSHDLRAPLRRIDGFAQILTEDHGEQLYGGAGDCVRRIRTQCRRMSDLIENLLRLSSITQGDVQRKRLDIADTAKAVIEDLRQADPDRCVECRIAESLPASGDPTLLRTVMENLLNNAWKFTSKTPEALIEVGASHRNGQRVYFVRDNGAGFDMSLADDLFRAFRRLHGDAEFDGNGIGLATVRRIVRRHGGNIWAEGEVDKGAAFYFTLETGAPGGA